MLNFWNIDWPKGLIINWVEFYYIMSSHFHTQIPNSHTNFTNVSNSRTQHHALLYLQIKWMSRVEVGKSISEGAQHKHTHTHTGAMLAQHFKCVYTVHTQACIYTWNGWTAARNLSLSLSHSRHLVSFYCFNYQEIGRRHIESFNCDRWCDMKSIRFNGKLRRRI